MPSHQVRKIRKDDEKGMRLAGASWTEITPPRKWLWYGVMGIIVLIAILGTSGNWTAFGFCVVLVIGCLVMTWVPGTQQRSFVFDRDGRMLAPEGLPFGNGHAIEEDSDSVGSIEATGRTYLSPDQESVWERNATNVAVISRDGDTIYVGCNLNIEAARLVAVTLTQALRAIRETRRPSGGSPNPALPDDDLIN